MMLRAAVVLLLVLNLGVAAWWLARPSMATVEASVPLDGLRLRLVGEPAAKAAVAAAATARGAGPGATSSPLAVPTIPDATAGAVTDAGLVPAAATAAPDSVVPVGTVPSADSTATAIAATAAAATATPAGPAAAAAPQCASLGPFPDAGVAAAAQRALAGLGIARASVREVTTSPRGWQVRIATQPDRAAADALAQRIGAAGFDDYLVVPSGTEANSIALGRYRGERAARERETALRVAGFQPITEPVGEASTQRWLDFVAPAGFDAEAARRATAASGSSLRACTGAG